MTNLLTNRMKEGSRKLVSYIAVEPYDDKFLYLLRKNLSCFLIHTSKKDMSNWKLLKETCLCN